MSLYFSYDPEGDGFQFHDTETEAKAAAEASLQEERDCAHEGWNDSVDYTCWGEVVQRVKETMSRPATEEDGLPGGIDEFVEYELLPVSEGPASFYIGEGTLCFDARSITDEYEHEDDLSVRTYDVCERLIKFDDQVYSAEVAELLETIAAINEDLYRSRQAHLTIEKCDKAKQLLDKISSVN